MKKIIPFFIISALLFNQAVKAEEIYEMPDTKAYILTEAVTGTVIASKNPDAKLPMASLTKLMLLLIAAEEIKAGNISFSDVVTVSAKASGMEGSVIWLEPNEKMRLDELVKSIVIASANDAAVAVAEYISKSEDAFVKKMNERAENLGMKNTHFENCVGYDNRMHYSTAGDLAKLTAEVFKYDYFNKFAQTRLDAVRLNTKRETQLLNTNKLIDNYKGLIGGKTGTTDEAGYCLAECAERDGMRLITIVLGAKNDEERLNLNKFLLDKGFNDYQILIFKPDAEKLNPVTVSHGVASNVKIQLKKNISCVILKNQDKNINYVYSVPENITAPVKRGQIIGNVRAELDNKLVFKAYITASENVPEMTFLKSCEFIIKKLFSI